MCSVAQRVTLRLCLAVFLLVIPSTTKSQSTELILDRVDEGKLNLLASQTAQKIREAPVAEGQVTSIYVLKGAPLGLTVIAINAAKQWRLKPAQKDGVPVSSRVELETTFHLY
jgi:hypothetical protein